LLTYSEADFNLWYLVFYFHSYKTVARESFFFGQGWGQSFVLLLNFQASESTRHIQREYGLAHSLVIESKLGSGAEPGRSPQALSIFRIYHQDNPLLGMF